MWSLVLLATAMAAVPNATLRNPVRPSDPRDLDKIVLDALNAALDLLINPALQKNMPDPFANMGLKPGGTSQICIIPNPFGGCICTASAFFGVEIDTVSGASHGLITSFTSAHLTATNLTSYSLTATASLQADKMHADGDGDNAHAGVSACGISPTVYGTASSDMDVPSASLQMTASATLTPQKCLKLHVDKATVLKDDLTMYNIDVEIDLGLFPLPISVFFDLFSGSLSDMVGEAVKEPIGDSIPGAVNPVLPCIPL